LGGPQNWSGYDGEEKNFQHLLGLESPIIQPVAQHYTTELSLLALGLAVKYKDITQPHFKITFNYLHTCES
jgi:hypothetical protein